MMASLLNKTCLADAAMMAAKADSGPLAGSRTQSRDVSGQLEKLHEHPAAAAAAGLHTNLNLWPSMVEHESSWSSRCDQLHFFTFLHRLLH